MFYAKSVIIRIFLLQLTLYFIAKCIYTNVYLNFVHSFRVEFSSTTDFCIICFATSSCQRLFKILSFRQKTVVKILSNFPLNFDSKSCMKSFDVRNIRMAYVFPSYRLIVNKTLFLGQFYFNFLHTTNKHIGIKQS